jgi:hypothetical protein
MDGGPFLGLSAERTVVPRFRTIALDSADLPHRPER